MTISIEHLLALAVSAMAGAFGWLWREIAGLRRAHGALEKDHHVHRTHVAEKYATKDDMMQSLDRVYAALERIEKKLDAHNN